MKKRLFTGFIISIIFQAALLAQNSASAANRNTALRCLRLAENCLVGGDLTNACGQAELGLSYDDSISDLIYVKAASSAGLGKTRAEVLEIIRDAFEKNNWLGYSQNGARILYADLLCDTGDYEASLKLLDSDPFILSADAEFIRVKNYYRMGTKESVNNARLKVNTARRIYPSDSRFPTIFFMFEYAFRSEANRTGLHYEADETVDTIARAYIAKLPDYKDLDNEVEILASFFADEKEKPRLLRAIDSKNKRNNPLFTIAALTNGIYSENQAFELFFNSFDDSIPVEMLQDFTLCLNEPEIKLRLAEWLTVFSGTLTVDVDLDLQNEMTVKYENGRPAAIFYDENMDGVNEVTARCDFGAPVELEYPVIHTSIEYAAYPEVSAVHFADEGRTFTFLHQDYSHTPFEFIADSVFTLAGVDFYVPRVPGDITYPDASYIVDAASAVELPNTEREGCKVVYSSDKGRLYFANFYTADGASLYAYADFSAGVPFIRHVDSDDDGYYETTEEYDAIPSDMEQGFSAEKQAAEIERIFGKGALTSKLYLKKIKIDRNANTFYEYSEEYYDYDGKMCSWDNDDDGMNDYFYIKSPQREGEALDECYIFSEESYPAVTIHFIDGIPVKLTVYTSEEMIYAGKTNGFYWVAEEGSDDMEAVALKAARNARKQGITSIAEADDKRFSIIKVAGTVFARILPESYVEEKQDD